MAISNGVKKNLSLFLPFLLLATLVFSGCGCSQTTTGYDVRLEVWGLFDDSDVMAKAISEYQRRNPRVKAINYKKLTIDSYENDLMEALATGNGPDVLLVHNTWITKHKDKLAPVPTETVNNQPVEILNTRQVKDQFADVTSFDFISDNEIYAFLSPLIPSRSIITATF